MTRLFGVVALAVMLIVSATAGTSMAAKEVGGMVDAELKAKTLDGQEATLKSMLGAADRTALVFMQTACAACRSEMRWLLQQKEDNPNINIIAISVDLRGQPAVEKYLESNPMFKDTVTFVLDPEYTLPPVFGFSYTPSMAIADKSGKILARHAGWNPKEITEVMKALK